MLHCTCFLFSDFARNVLPLESLTLLGVDNLTIRILFILWTMIFLMGSFIYGTLLFFFCFFLVWVFFCFDTLLFWYGIIFLIPYFFFLYNFFSNVLQIVFVERFFPNNKSKKDYVYQVSYTFNEVIFRIYVVLFFHQ